MFYRLLRILMALLISALPLFAFSEKGLQKPIFTITDSPATSINVVWLLNREQATRFSYRAAGESDLRTHMVSREQLAPDANLDACKAQLRGLNPDTVYEINLGEGTYTVRTHPETRPDDYTLVAGGDMMHTTELYRKGTEAMASRNPSVALLGGDLAYANGKAWSLWADWLDIWADTAIDADGHSIPAIICIGNHEVIGEYGQTPQQAPMFFKLFPFPEELKSNYVVDMFDDLSVVILDSNHTQSVDAQKSWLKDTLIKRKDRRHLFALYHFPAYPVTKGGLENPLSLKIRSHWTPIFDAYGLDAAFENDHHLYKRTAFIKSGVKDDEGTLYIGDGVWGVHLRQPESKDLWYIEEAQGTHHVIELQIKDNIRIYRAVNHQKEVFDSVEDTRDCLY